MLQSRTRRRFWPWRQRVDTAWGSLLDEQDILVAALSLQKAGRIRVLVFEHVRAPDDLDDTSARDNWLVQTLRVPGQHLPANRRTMALALRESRCRQGTLFWQGATDPRTLAAEVQLEAASALGVDPADIGFDFQVVSAAPHEGVLVHWAACLRSELQQWQRHARKAGWRLPVVETEHQAARRAATHLSGELQQHWAHSPQDWHFEGSPQRELAGPLWAQLQTSVAWGPLVACGAALGALL